MPNILTAAQVAEIEQRANGLVEPLSPNTQVICWDDVPALCATLRHFVKNLKSAREDLEDWGCYVPGYFKEKHDFEGDLALYDAALAAWDGEKHDDSV